MQDAVKYKAVPTEFAITPHFKEGGVRLKLDIVAGSSTPSGSTQLRFIHSDLYSTDEIEIPTGSEYVVAGFIKQRDSGVRRRIPDIPFTKIPIAGNFFKLKTISNIGNFLGNALFGSEDIDSKTQVVLYRIRYVDENIESPAP